MRFDAERFERAEFEPRTRLVEISAQLAEFCEVDDDGDGGEAIKWTVRNLTASEMSRAIDAGKTQRNIDQVVQAVSDGAQVEAVRKALGISRATPGEIAKRLEMLVAGCVDPKITLPQAVKIAEHCATDFWVLTGAINDLSGQGSELKKPAAASKTTTS